MLDKEKQVYFKKALHHAQNLNSFAALLLELHENVKKENKYGNYNARSDEFDLTFDGELWQDYEEAEKLEEKVAYTSTEEDLLTQKGLMKWSDRRRTRYHTFSIPKKSGGERVISAPQKELKIIQKYLNLLFQLAFEPHSSSFGFLPNKNVADNARKHVGKPFVYNIDLKDFFPSISFYRVKKVLSLPPFNLSNTKENPLAATIANLCCENGALPQGAPTSPILTNIIAKNLDHKLTKFAKNHKIKYTRYADDISFSGYYDFVQDAFVAELKHLIHSEGFAINEKKVRLQNYQQRQEVTGIVVNKKTNVPKNYRKTVRFWLFLWEKYGFEEVNTRFQADYSKEKAGLDKDNKEKKYSLLAVLKGKIAYWGLVCGKDDVPYKAIRQKFLDLSKNAGDLQEIDSLLTIWEKENELQEIDELLAMLEEDTN